LHISRSLSSSDKRKRQKGGSLGKRPELAFERTDSLQQMTQSASFHCIGSAVLQLMFARRL
jgi:hypothetical protein